MAKKKKAKKKAKKSELADAGCVLGNRNAVRPSPKKACGPKAPSAHKAAQTLGAAGGAKKKKRRRRNPEEVETSSTVTGPAGTVTDDQSWRMRSEARARRVAALAPNPPPMTQKELRALKLKLLK